MKSKVRFNYAMSKLHDYSLVEVRSGSYSLHTCVHDWTIEFLNRRFEQKLYQLAVRCIGQSVEQETEAEYWVKNRRLLQHIERLEHDSIKDSINWNDTELTDLVSIANLCNQFNMNTKAEAIYLRALQGFEKVLGAEHMSTLDTVNNLGILYNNQGRMAEAEAMRDTRNEDMSNVDVWIWKCMDASHGPEMHGSEPSMLPHLTPPGVTIPDLPPFYFSSDCLPCYVTSITSP